MATMTMSVTSASKSREPSPNRGMTIPDHVEAGEVQMSQNEFRTKYGIDASKQVKLVKVVFMRYQHPDLQEIKIFMKDFGLKKVKETATDIWFRGYGVDQYVYHVQKGPKKFLGGAFEAESYEELGKAIKIPGAKVLTKGIEKMENAPGGGYIVTLADPEGFPINIVYGQTPRQAESMPAKLAFNLENDKPRVREFARFKPGPAAVHKLGHYGLVVDNFDAVMDFYTKNFNFVPSNVLYTNADGKTVNVGMFAHIDRGDDLVDHHTLFCVKLAPGQETPHVHHCSFEIHDMDTQAMGHDWLMKKGYKLVWGLGRHVLGSQIFDYWWDVNGFMVEHYIDGDVVNKETPVGFHSADNAVDTAWGPDVPSTFLE
ncbi:uncharacterized protein PV06_03345 [Exophiala oligosperma]|uniref:VOC domain-containing protein n=2 Tax=Chaetothyriales TaxID=34395 RepID=A0A0D2EA94_9EURO|nr:uncharacterized protein PV06_03345 [Exophiala oligosperma]KIW44909.1 hypothetical protein PV06_03345 [Exophiala oligosperma]